MPSTSKFRSYGVAAIAAMTFFGLTACGQVPETPSAPGQDDTTTTVDDTTETTVDDTTETTVDDTTETTVDDTDVSDEDDEEDPCDEEKD
ncbi:MAG: hypothetical protein S0880_32190, partial [Actinomycetota bacterium]|nr:hypothetical protein [Actinomycetota bacterium]